MPHDQQIHLTKLERDYLRQLVLECDLQRFSRQESHAYIRAKLGKQISDSWLDKVRQNLKKNLASKVEKLRKHKTALIEQFFRRIAEIEKYQQALWAEYHMHPDKPYVRVDCIQELHQLTKTLGNLYEILL